ncbi:MAG: PAS domain S-box protein [Fibrobacterota bacterium]
MNNPEITFCAGLENAPSAAACLVPIPAAAENQADLRIACMNRLFRRFLSIPDDLCTGDLLSQGGAVASGFTGFAWACLLKPKDGRGRSFTWTPPGKTCGLAGDFWFDDQGRLMVYFKEELSSEHTEEQAYYRAMAEHITESIVITDEEGTIIYVNSFFTDLTGYTKQEVLGENPRILQSGQTPASVYRQLWDTVLRGSVWHGEFINRKKGGAVYREDALVIPVPLGTKMRFMGIKKDISEEVALKESLGRSEKRLTAALNASPLGIAFINGNGLYVDANHAFEKLTGYSRHELITRHVGALVPAEIGDRGFTHFNELQKKGFSRSNVLFRIRSGELLWVDLTAVRLSDDLYIGFHEDVTGRKKLERALIKEKQRAEEANRAKNRFLANITHEIRTPLSAVIGFSELLLKSDLSDKQSTYVSSIHNSGRSLLSIVNDILSLSRIDSGKVRLSHEMVSPDSFIGDICDIFRAKARAKNVKLILDIPFSVPAKLSIDPVRVRQVLINLLGNAVKFTEIGYVRVCVEIISVTDTNRADFLFTVEDTGIGIKQDVRKNILESFIQGDLSSTKRYGGTGLGLSIAQKILDLMDSSLFIDGSPGKGSTFSFSLNCRYDQERKCIPAVSSLPENEHILLITECAMQGKVLCNRLHELGLRHVSCLSPDTAEWPEDHTEMGRTILYERAAVDHSDQLRNIIGELWEKQDSRVRLVPIRAYGEEADSETRRDVLHAPVRPSELYAVLFRLFHGDSPALRSVAAGTEEGETQLPTLHTTVLVVDDNSVNLLLMQSILGELLPAATVLTAESGEESVRICRDQFIPLVFMDIQMPGMDGFQAARTIKQHAGDSRRSTAVVALTAGVMERERYYASESGIDLFLRKPLKRSTVEDILKTFLLGRPLSFTQNTVYRGSSSRDHFDAKALLDRLRGNQKLYGQLLRESVSALKKHFSDLHDAHKAGNENRFSQALHTLKGMAANMSFSHLVKVLIECENLPEDNSRQESVKKIGAEIDLLISEHIPRELLDEQG